MTCKDCIHKSICYRVDSVQSDYACKCGDFESGGKVLKQEPVLDKIRAEIEALPKTYPFMNHIDAYVKEDDVRKIIDKHKTESEG